MLKQIIIISCTILVCFHAHSETINLKWYIDDNNYTITQCESGTNVIVPEHTEKQGYTFKGWAGGYTKLEYLQGTGAQYIDTGVAYNSALASKPFKMDGTFAFVNHMTDSNSYRYVAGASNTVHAVLQYIYLSNPEAFLWSRNQTGAGMFGVGLKDYELKKPYRVISETNPANKTYTVYNSFTDISAEKELIYNGTSNNNIYLFECNGVNQTGPFIIYHWSFESNGVLLRNFIPVKTEDNKFAMYDTVNQQYYYNKGSGNFTGGPNIGRQIETNDTDTIITCPYNDVSIYPVYEPNTITLNWDYKDETGRTEQTQCVYDTPITDIPETPVRAGYKFMGWRVKVPE